MRPRQLREITPVEIEESRTEMDLWVAEEHPAGNGSMKTIAELLAEAGYGYRQSRMVGRREVYRISDGAIIGNFTAQDACNFLEGTHANR